MRDNLPRESDSQSVIKEKAFNASIAAVNKPYFMTYVYSSLKTRYNDYIRNNDYGVIMRFGGYGIKNIDELRKFEPKTKEMLDYLHHFDKFIPVGNNPCVVNRICWIFENEFNGYLLAKREHPEFDYEILKSHVEYSRKCFNEISVVFKKYQKRLDSYMKYTRLNKTDPYSDRLERIRFVEDFKRKCDEICTNENELCDIIIDICYSTEKTKQFAWDVCGNTILKNLLKLNGDTIHFPERVNENGEFEYCGEQFVMREKIVSGEYYDCIE